MARTHSERNEGYDEYVDTLIASLLNSGRLRLIPDRRQRPERRTKANGGRRADDVQGSIAGRGLVLVAKQSP
jgi:hypothetical protein